MLKMLLHAGADVHAKWNSIPDIPSLAGTGDITALHFASEGKNLEIVEDLIKAGADINAKDSEWSDISPATYLTPLFYAVLNGNPAIARLLIENGACINCDDGNGETPLIYAVRQNNLVVLQELIKAGADVNKMYSYRMELPIHEAVRNDNKEIVLELIRAGADLNFKNSESKTPLDIAIDNKNQDMINILLSFIILGSRL